MEPRDWPRERLVAEITALRRRVVTLEQEQRGSEARLRQVIDLVPHFIFAKDCKGRIILVNRAVADALGTTVEDLTGMTDADFAHSEDDVRQFRATDTEVLESGRPLAIPEEQVTDVDGNIRYLQTIKVPFTCANSNLPSVLGVSVDITARKRAEDEREAFIGELKEKNVELERFAYTVSHDLKTPLVTISGFLGLLEEDALAGDRERIEQDMERIRGATETMRLLLDDLLALSRIGRVINPPETVSLEELARQAAKLCGQLEARGVRLEVGGELPAVNGDRGRLLEVFQNLLDNAVKFMGDQPEPRIEIGGRRQGDKVACFVRDNGGGIDPRYHEKVFALFQRLTPAIEGTGIGLTLVRRIVEVHEGKIWIESEGEGHGSTFWFTLPAASP